MRGGEQLKENDRSVTMATQKGSRSELDSVCEAGRVCERKTKPVTRALGEELKRRTSGQNPDNSWKVGDRTVGRPRTEIRETRRGQAEFRAREKCGPKSRPTGVRASVVAGKRVTTVEPRDAGKWMSNEPERRR
jgi:hypothetical protein